MWGVIQTKPLKERAVCRQLQERGLRSYLPLYRRRPPRSDRPPVLAPLFPGYLFVDVSERESAYRAMWTPGVLRLLATDNRPHVVPDELVEEIRSRERGRGYVILRKRFSPREKVRITRGLLAGFEGVFQQETSDGERVRLLLSHLGYQAMVELPTEDLESAEPFRRPSRSKRKAENGR